MTTRFHWDFIDDDGTFSADGVEGVNNLYFPLANELGLLSAVTPRLAGDIKRDQHTFLTIPVSIDDLHLSLAGRNFWVAARRDGNAPIFWALNGQSAFQRGLSAGAETVRVTAGLLWHTITRENRAIGLRAEIRSFVPAAAGAFEIMAVEMTNTGDRPVEIAATSAVPLFARSADDLRDHRHVTSLLNRIKPSERGLVVTPTMTFNERGHRMNDTSYFVLGSDGDGRPPEGAFPTFDAFIGENGDLFRPNAVFAETKPKPIGARDQGKEAMGALSFGRRSLAPGATARFIVCLGVCDKAEDPEAITGAARTWDGIMRLWEETAAGWRSKNDRIVFRTGDADFNGWMRWVCVQPTLRKIFGCSFLPDFDYGRGGRGWRDLWQDCLALLLADPAAVRPMILANFDGVRFDGSNATIIGRKNVKTVPAPDGSVEYFWEPEFIADRNNVTRTWMDHGVWPLITTDLYLQQTGDWEFLLEERPYFRDAQLRRGRKLDREWIQNEAAGRADRELKAKSGQAVKATVLEHLLVQHLVQFFNVGEHNMIRLEDADWNDGLDMAKNRGESVAFTALYAGNFDLLADVLEGVRDRKGWRDVTVTAELTMLLDRAGHRVPYDDPGQKRQRLAEFFTVIEKGLSGDRASVSIAALVSDLRAKAEWLRNVINESEWIEGEGCGWYNGYYDDEGRRVEGLSGGAPRVTLTGQVYPIMANVASDDRIRQTVTAVNEHLWDHALGGVRLNTDFGAIQPALGRAFSFAYGEKENGAVFSHMAVMYANALYRRGFAEEGFRVLRSLFDLAKHADRSRIFPGLPEYFNNEGRGRYQYLTGSASWYVLTLLTEVFGVRGLAGDLLIAPKLVPEQFGADGRASVVLTFAGSRISVTFENPKRVPPERAVVEKVTVADDEIPYSRKSGQAVVIQRELIQQQSTWNFIVRISEKKG